MMIELSSTKVFMKLGEFAVTNGTITEGIEYGMMKGGTSTSVPVVEPCSFRGLQLDEQPDHLLILVHGILARSVPLNCSWIGNEVWLFELCILWNLNAWSPLPLEKNFRMKFLAINSCSICFHAIVLLGTAPMTGNMWKISWSTDLATSSWFMVMWLK